MKRLLATQGYGRNTTRCIRAEFDFQPAGRRRVEAAFDAGRVSSDGGLLLLRELTKSSGVFRRFASCFRDHRDPSRIEHTVEELLAQRVLGLLCGYEDLNDHDTLRDDARALGDDKAAPQAPARAIEQELDVGLELVTVQARIRPRPIDPDHRVVAQQQQRAVQRQDRRPVGHPRAPAICVHRVDRRPQRPQARARTQRRPQQRLTVRDQLPAPALAVLTAVMRGVAAHAAARASHDSIG
ncbi:transposase [Nannocystis bainbridge]|uniref:Transposase n=1 Tax=Nannocystis bainbridge TaxID=2995303 RepID=A0ABT5E3D1_9BACT|nr:transposase [Nannocystis bainbridge]MDC0720374.1 transposase [Nannocystis bainbridge]